MVIHEYKKFFKQFKKPSRLLLLYILTASLQKSKTPTTNECPAYDAKPSIGEAPVLELKGMWSILSFPLLPGPLWPGVVVLVRVPSMSLKELFYCVQTNNWC